MAVEVSSSFNFDTLDPCKDGEIKVDQVISEILDSQNESTQFSSESRLLSPSMSTTSQTFPRTYISPIEQSLMGDHGNESVLRLERSLQTFVEARSTRENRFNLSLENCLICNSTGYSIIINPDGSISYSDEHTLFCHDCGECFHTFCLSPPISKTFIKPHLHEWRCPDCKFCTICKKIDQEDDLVVCDRCDQCFHSYCANLSEKEKNEQEWICIDCRICANCSEPIDNIYDDIPYYRRYCLCHKCQNIYNQRTNQIVERIIPKSHESDSSCSDDEDDDDDTTISSYKSIPVRKKMAKEIENEQFKVASNVEQQENQKDQMNCDKSTTQSLNKSTRSDKKTQGGTHEQINRQQNKSTSLKQNETIAPNNAPNLPRPRIGPSKMAQNDQTKAKEESVQHQNQNQAEQMANTENAGINKQQTTTTQNINQYNINNQNMSIYAPNNQIASNYNVNNQNMSGYNVNNQNVNGYNVNNQNMNGHNVNNQNVNAYGYNSNIQSSANINQNSNANTIGSNMNTYNHQYPFRHNIVSPYSGNNQQLDPLQQSNEQQASPGFLRRNSFDQRQQFYHNNNNNNLDSQPSRVEMPQVFDALISPRSKQFNQPSHGNHPNHSSFNNFTHQHNNMIHIQSNDYNEPQHQSYPSNHFNQQSQFFHSNRSHPQIPPRTPDVDYILTSPRPSLPVLGPFTPSDTIGQISQNSSQNIQRGSLNINNCSQFNYQQQQQQFFDVQTPPNHPNSQYMGSNQQTFISNSIPPLSQPSVHSTDLIRHNALLHQSKPTHGANITSDYINKPVFPHPISVPVLILGSGGKSLWPPLQEYYHQVFEVSVHTFEELTKYFVGVMDQFECPPVLFIASGLFPHLNDCPSAEEIMEILSFTLTPETKPPYRLHPTDYLPSGTVIMPPRELVTGQVRQNIQVAQTYQPVHVNTPNLQPNQFQPNQPHTIQSSMMQPHRTPNIQNAPLELPHQIQLHQPIQQPIQNHLQQQSIQQPIQQPIQNHLQQQPIKTHSSQTHQAHFIPPTQPQLHQTHQPQFPHQTHIHQSTQPVIQPQSINSSSFAPSGDFNQQNQFWYDQQQFNLQQRQPEQIHNNDHHHLSTTQNPQNHQPFYAPPTQYPHHSDKMMATEQQQQHQHHQTPILDDNHIVTTSQTSKMIQTLQPPIITTPPPFCPPPQVSVHPQPYRVPQKLPFSYTLPSKSFEANEELRHSQSKDPSDVAHSTSSSVEQSSQVKKEALFSETRTGGIKRKNPSSSRPNTNKEIIRTLKYGPPFLSILQAKEWNPQTVDLTQFATSPAYKYVGYTVANSPKCNQKDCIFVNSQNVQQYDAEVEPGEDNRRCVLCSSLGERFVSGRLLPLQLADQWVHANCAAWSTGSIESDYGELKNIVQIISVSKKAICTHCKSPGATLNCVSFRCPCKYHLTCAIRANCRFVSDPPTGYIFCEKHGAQYLKLEWRAGKERATPVPKHQVDHSPHSIDSNLFKLTRKLHASETELRHKVAKKEAKIPLSIWTNYEFRVGALTVHRLGSIVNNDYFQTKDCIFTNQYEASRIFWSWKAKPENDQKPSRRLHFTSYPPRCPYTMKITMKNKRPWYSIQCHDDPNAIIESSSAQDAWRIVLDRIREFHQSLLTTSQADGKYAGRDFSASSSSSSGSSSSCLSLAVSKDNDDEHSTSTEQIHCSPSSNCIERSSPSKLSSNSSFRPNPTTFTHISTMLDPIFYFGMTTPQIQSHLEKLPDSINLSIYKRRYDMSIVIPTNLFRMVSLYYDPDEDLEILEPQPNESGAARTQPWRPISSSERFKYGDAFGFHPAAAVSEYVSRVASLSKWNQSLFPREVEHSSRGPSNPQALTGYTKLVKYKLMKMSENIRLKVLKSKIQGWGLFVMEDVCEGEFLIEYVGEIISQKLADKREKYYQSRGIGCYMFSLDDSEVIDATEKGNHSRFINHSCEPNCATQIQMIGNQKKIVIYAQKPIKQGSELTYDYCFPDEEEKLTCYCGAATCKGTMN